MINKICFKCIIIVIYSIVISCENVSTKRGRYSLIEENYHYIDQEFKRLNNGILDSHDSCTFMNFILSYDNYSQLSLSKQFDNIVISNFTCPFSDFSFSVIETSEKEMMFYGNFDIHYLRFREDQTDSAQLVRFENQGINNLINRMLAPQDRYLEKDISEKLIFLLYQLYFENVNGVSQSIFDEILKKSELANYISNEAVLDGVMDILGNDGNSVIFKERYAGIVIFKWTIDNGLIAVSEYLIPFRKFTYLRKDILPEFSCK